MAKQVIILFGAPGAGKGTQSELLAGKLGLYLFETSKILEREFKKPSQEVIEIDGQKFDVLSEKENWSKGILNSPPWVTYLVVKEIKRLAEQGENIIFAGSPRTVYEAERVVPVLEQLYGKENIKIILMEIDAQTTIFRNTHRKICELMRHSILFNDETKDLKTCPLDGSNLVARKDLDSEETIKTRLKEYAERTLPMVEYFEKNGLKVQRINGQQTPSDVHNDILKAIQ
jgi:adenylate kinase